MLRALAKELGVSDRVHFTGWLDDTEALYASLDICLLTSLSETFPYAPSPTRQNTACRSFATAVGGVSELWKTAFTAFSSPRYRRACIGYFDALARSGAAQVGTALRDRTAKEFSLSAMALREKEICRAVLSPRREIVIAGAYGCGNRGDELMLENLLRDGRAAAPECAVTVLSHRPKETARRFDVDSLYYLNVPAIRRRMKSARALVFGGGNLLQDATSRRSLVYYLALLRKGKQSGCRTLLHGAGLGPLSPRGWAKCTAALNECADTLVFRERESLAAARKNGINAPELILGADGAAETSRVRAAGERPSRLPRRGRGAPPFPAEYARAAAEIAAKRGWKLRYIAMNVRQDLPLCRALVSRPAGKPPPRRRIPRRSRAFSPRHGSRYRCGCTRSHSRILPEHRRSASTVTDASPRLRRNAAYRTAPWKNAEISPPRSKRRLRRKRRTQPYGTSGSRRTRRACPRALRAGKGEEK